MSFPRYFVFHEVNAMQQVVPDFAEVSGDQGIELLTDSSMLNLTPVSDRTPAIVSIPDKELSGDQWVSRFTESAKLDDLIEPFQTNVRSFKSAIEAAGASVRISATYRPVERAYMMHWSYLIAKGTKKAKDIPALSGVNIEWDHGDEKNLLRQQKK
jgi:hypothetical protein